MIKTIVISGDIISSTSLTVDDRKLLEQQLKTLIDQLETKYNTYSRIIKGDYLECVVSKPQDALKVALLIKCFVKAISISNDASYKNNHRIKFFKSHGIRLALGYGELERFDKTAGVIDGDAIYRSGRMISENSTHGKQRIVIKNTLFFSSDNTMLNEQMDALLSLLDTIIVNATARQCEVVYHKILGLSEDEISTRLDIGQPTVNQHSTSIGWNSIETTLNYFSTLFSNL